VKRNRRKFLSAEAIEEEEEESEQDQLSMDTAIGASKIMELEEQLKEARLHLEQQMNLVGTQTEEISQLQYQLVNEKRVRSMMGSNAIRKDEAIEAVRNLTAKTIEGLKISVEKLNKELAETKDRLVNAQIIDLQVQTQENAQKEQLQAELSQEKQTVVLLQAEMEGLRVRLEEIQRIPPPAPVYIPVQPQVDETQIRQWEQETQENQKTIDLLKREVHRKDQRFWEEEANSPPSTSLFRNYETQKNLFLFLYDYRPGQTLSQTEFEDLWNRMEILGKENLLVEMLCRNVLKLSDPLAAVILMGDIGARVTMYYMELELRI
jgi:hypothetical protein